MITVREERTLKPIDTLGVEAVLRKVTIQKKRGRARKIQKYSSLISTLSIK